MKKTTNKPISRFSKYINQFNYSGLIIGGLFICLSLLPSLLPRPWLMQGFISGVSFTIGYGIGVLFSKILRWLTQKEPTKKQKALAWKIIKIMPALILISIIVGHNWQNEVRVLVGQEPQNAVNIIQITIVTILFSLFILSICRGLRKLANKLSKFFGRWVPRRVGILFGTGLAALLFVWIINGFLLKTLINVANNIYSNANSQTSEGITQPQNIYRSGNPKSAISWQSLGSRGRDFVARGPSQQQLETFSGQTPMEPIRIYSGLESADSPRERAKLAVADLKLAGAFERDVLVIATATGSGWLEPQAVDSLEYMYNGNSAIVSQQYSYLPSWISFLVDSENAKDAGRELYDAVYTEWIKIPISNRPKLIAYGLSLGSFGGQSAFSSVQDLRRSVDGALYIGTPSNTELWRSITDNRDAGSTEIKPVFENGETVRFASSTEVDTAKLSNEWSNPRVLFLQHASDPVIWFSFDLMIKKPDWLNEPRGSDVSSRTRWIPFVSFFQVTVDQFYGVTVPNGHGHNYANDIVSAWAEVAQPENWTKEQSVKLQTLIDTYANE